MAVPSVEQWMVRYGQVPHRKRWAALSGGWLLILAAYVWCVAYPEVSSLDDLNARLAQAEDQKREKERFSRDFSRYEQELSVYKQRLDDAHEILPDDPDVPQFLSRLGGMARDLDVAIERLEPRAEVPRDFYAEIGLDVVVRGAFHQIATLIDQISNQSRIVHVSEISFFDAKVVDDQVAVEGHFQVTMYRFLTEQQIAELANKEKKQ